MEEKILEKVAIEESKKKKKKCIAKGDGIFFIRDYKVTYRLPQGGLNSIHRSD